MAFNKKLSLLMTVMGVTNSSLARALSIDASLISRWRTGKRTPAKNSSYIRATAEFFARQAKMDFQKAALCEITGAPMEQQDAGASTMAEFLCSWLSEDDVPRMEIVEKFLGSLEEIGTTKDARKLPAGAKDMSAGLPLSTEVFYGIKGKQNSVIRFLSAVAAQKKPLTLLLYSDESMEWMSVDKGFLAEFIPLIFDVVAKGNRIKIIHVVSRDLSEMLAAIDFWLPLYMTGAIEPYYHPRHREHFFRRTMFIAPGVSVLTSVTLAGRESSAPNLLCTDPQLINSLIAEFNDFLSMCRPLVHIYTTGNSPELAAFTEQFDEQPGDCICMSNTLSCTTMPEDLFRNLLSRARLDEQTKEKLHRKWQAKNMAFIKNSKHYQYTEITNIPSFGEIISCRAQVELTDFSGSAALFYTPQEYKSHLLNIVHLLKNCPNFHFCTSYQAPMRNICLTVKDEAGAIVYKTDHPPAVFTFSQQNMTNAFFCYLEEMVDRTPKREKEKQQVILRLSEIAGQIPGY